MKRRLGVNIDHVATLRQVRGTSYPNPVDTIPILKACRVDQITVHLREDRRHIQDADVIHLIRAKELPINLELALHPSIIEFALRHRPHTCTFVPEKRQELTTEGGLDCIRNFKKLSQAVRRMNDRGIRTSLFIEATPEQIHAARDTGADAIEIHTGTYCDLAATARSSKSIPKIALKECDKIAKGSAMARSLGLEVYAGHGLNVQNLAPIVAIPEIVEYNIGHAIVARAVFIGFKAAVREIQNALR